MKVVTVDYEILEPPFYFTQRKKKEIARKIFFFAKPFQKKEMSSKTEISPYSISAYEFFSGVSVHLALRLSKCSKLTVVYLDNKTHDVHVHLLETAASHLPKMELSFNVKDKDYTKWYEYLKTECDETQFPDMPFVWIPFGGGISVTEPCWIPLRDYKTRQLKLTQLWKDAYGIKLLPETQAQMSLKETQDHFHLILQKTLDFMKQDQETLLQRLILTNHLLSSTEHAKKTRPKSSKPIPSKDVHSLPNVPEKSWFALDPKFRELLEEDQMFNRHQKGGIQKARITIATEGKSRKRKEITTSTDSHWPFPSFFRQQDSLSLSDLRSILTAQQDFVKDVLRYQAKGQPQEFPPVQIQQRRFRVKACKPIESTPTVVYKLNPQKWIQMSDEQRAQIFKGLTETMLI